MKRNTFQFTNRVPRAMLALAVSAVLVGVGVAARAKVKNTFKSGDPLSSLAINDNFADLDARLSAIEAGSKLVVTKGGKPYSLGATYCGKTAAAAGAFVSGNLTGYAASKPQCESSCNSPTAHMCTAEEIVRSGYANIKAESGWYSSGSFAVVQATNMLNARDCNGWTDTSGGVGGAWLTPTGSPAYDSCNQSHPILCCD